LLDATHEANARVINIKVENFTINTSYLGCHTLASQKEVIIVYKTINKRQRHLLNRNASVDLFKFAEFLQRACLLWVVSRHRMNVFVCKYDISYFRKN